jgi:phage terminase large subunit GpA-like protein
MDSEFFQQLTAEQLVTKVVKGYRKNEWVKTRERNEALDTRVYARAAASQFGIDRFNDARWEQMAEMVGSKAAAMKKAEPPKPAPVAGPVQQGPGVHIERNIPDSGRGGWLGGRGKNWL